ncbi:hypothetical protein [Kitasatospora sp. NPDC093102]|uniref:hypothetical protein n=1 Tax=Kitasatospora sp. NPDC093102 TaxID=3155069 RepID=UPI0034306898
MPPPPRPVTALETSLRRQGARTHDLRLWPTVYPQTGREGLAPAALVLQASRERHRPDAKRLTPQQKEKKAEPDHERPPHRMAEVKAAAEACRHAPAYGGDAVRFGRGVTGTFGFVCHRH